MSHSPDLCPSHRTSPRRTTTSLVTVPWASDAAREAVARTCQEVARWCQRVIARHASAAGGGGYGEPRDLDRDDLAHVTVGDLNPTAPNTMDGYRACDFK